MLLKINNKWFVGKYNKKNELVISLDNIDDVQYFKEWVNKRTGCVLKKSYVKDVPIFKVNEYGVLKNSIPFLNSNENKVKIVYDYYADKTIINNQSSKQSYYIMGIDTYDEDILVYCLFRYVNGKFEILLNKKNNNKNEFKQEIENISKYFNAEIIH